MEQSSIVLNTSTDQLFIDTSTIVRIEASSNYSKIYFSNGKVLVTAKLLKWFEEKLPQQSFIRLHRSHLVNNLFMSTFQRNLKAIELTNGNFIQVSKRRRKSVLMKFLAFFMMAFLFQSITYSQNVGIGTNTPAAKLHIKGSADTSQLFIDANAVQTTGRPLIKLRNSSGTDLLWLHSDNASNSFVGVNAGRVNNAAGGATWNTFIGGNTGNDNTLGHSNTANGYNALFNNTTGDFNTAVGRIALNDNTTGSNNTAIGGAALNNNAASNNTALGRNALFSNVGGSNATAIGYAAMQYSSNLASAFDSRNVAVGFEALRGGSVIASNNTGNSNTVIGNQALRNNTTGCCNTASGNLTLFDNSTGSSNTVSGSQALTNNTSGSQNTACGSLALFDNSIGDLNTAIGYTSLFLNASGENNTAIGDAALYSNTTGIGNTASGSRALYLNATGSYNTSMGRNAYNANDFLDNTTLIGYATGGIGAHNRIDIGNSSVNNIAGQVPWSTYSDRRIKDNISANVPGLAFISLLRPVTYNLNIHRQNKMIYAGKEEGNWPSKYDIEKTTMSGFIAQEVEKAATDIGYKFSGVQKPDNPDDLYLIRYSDFVMPLVKAVQELNQKSDEQLKMIAELRKEIELLKTKK